MNNEWIRESERERERERSAIKSKEGGHRHNMYVYVRMYKHTMSTKRGGLDRGWMCVWLSEECALGHEYHLTVSNAQTTFGR